jgi:hypothetical protein
MNTDTPIKVKKANYLNSKTKYYPIPTLNINPN